MARPGVKERGLRGFLKKVLRRRRFRHLEPGGTDLWPGDEGSAGVREPRRPVHPPGDLAAEEPVP
jgi:hypothetical protein